MTPVAFTNEQVAALKTMQRIWPKEQIVLIGASALGHLIDMRWRQTHDLDFSISISAEEYAHGLKRLPGWTRDQRFEQRWIAPGDVRIDIIPAGPKLLAVGEIVWPESGIRMSLVGLRLAFENSLWLHVAEDLELQVARAPVIAVLKMVAYQDRPHERLGDLSDLAYLIDECLPEDDPRRFADEAFQFGLSYEDTSAFFLGREIGSIVNETEHNAVNSFVAIVRDESDPLLTQTKMALSGPAAWRKDPRILLKRLHAFDRGLSFGGSGR